ncbi:hypothetical protein [Nonomuraea rubra]|uniref:hypothetical protein n=1 Tax=Nonomuraea rubra TaxID=46180 RepID=UPI0031EE5B37
MDDSIVITGARVNNLKNVSLRIPKNRLVVFTGVSGSGKSSLVFGTVAAESQRQLNETYTAFIRNRLPSHDKPDVETIDNLGAAIVVDQKPVGGNARSTVGTMTDIMPILRVLFSRYGTPSAGYSFAYSFNDPAGMCPGCDGLGRAVRLDLDALIDPARSLDDGAIRFPLFGVGTWQWQIYARSGTFDPQKPVGDYTPAERDLLLHGSGFTVDVHGKNGTLNKVDYEGVADRFTRLYLRRDTSTLSQRTRDAVQDLVTEGVCPRCDGARLNAAALATRIGPHSIADHAAMEITDLIAVLTGLGNPVAEAAVRALRRLDDIGLGYLTLARETSTVSGGEAQRLKTVRHLGSALTGMTYVFDEPTAGLHPSDVGRLTRLLRALRDKGNTVLVVEHDPDVIAVADHVIDLGPGAGVHGGHIVYTGSPAGLPASGTRTGHALARRTALKTEPRRPTGRLTLSPASLHNLHDITTTIPTGVLTCVTGVAGSGKSTLITPHPARPAPRRRRRRPGRPRHLRPLQPRLLPRRPGADPPPVRPRRRRPARPVQLQLRRRLPPLRRTRCHPHRPGVHGPRHHGVRAVRRHPLPARGAHPPAARPVDRRRARPDRRAGRRVLHRTRRGRPPGRPRRRRTRLPHPRPAHQHPVRRRAAAHETRRRAVQDRRRAHPGRTHHRAAPVRRRDAHRPAGPARRRRQHRHRHRAPPRRGQARRLGDRPRARRRQARRPDPVRRAARGPAHRAGVRHRRPPQGRTRRPPLRGVRRKPRGLRCTP